MENLEKKTTDANTANSDENLSKALESMLQTFYNVERKNDEGDILKPDVSKSTTLEIGYLIISTLEQLVNDFITLYCNTTNAKKDEVSVEILKTMKILTSKPTIDNEITEQLKNIDNAIIKMAIVYVFIETWNGKMIDENKSIVIKKDTYLEALKKEIEKRQA